MNVKTKINLLQKNINKMKKHLDDASCSDLSIYAEWSSVLEMLLDLDIEIYNYVKERSK